MQKEKQYKELGEKIGKFRYEMDLTQEELASMVQVTPMTIRNWESGDKQPKYKNLKKLIEIYIEHGNIFPQGEEKTEAEDLWDAANMRLPFDEEWFDQILLKYTSLNNLSDTDTLQVGQENELAKHNQPSSAQPDSSPPTTHDSRIASLSGQQRHRMLDLVESIWIRGILKESMPGNAHITLKLNEQPDLVESPLDPLRQGIYQFENPPLPTVSFVEAYDKANGKLLLLGEPGSGKTVLLLELARELLGHARRHHNQPIPVIFLLKSWAQKRLPLEQWLVEELHTKYHVPPELGEQWIKNDQILLLLDGLDEVALSARAACVNAINTYLHEHGLAPTVITSRNRDYSSLPKRLHLHNAVVVQPLIEDQIDSYLSSIGEQTDILREALQYTPDMRKLATTPLMLYILVTAYEDRRVGYSQATRTLDNQQQALASYVAKMLERRSPLASYTPEQTIHWLQWLARQLNRHNQSDFHIEHMQFDWRPEHRFHRIYQELAVGFVYGLLTSLGFSISYIPFFPLHQVLMFFLLIMLFNTFLYVAFNGIILRLLDSISAQNNQARPDHEQHLGVRQRVINLLRNRVTYGVLNGIFDGIFVGVLVSAVSGWICGLFICAFCAALGTLDPQIKGAEYLSWSWSIMRRNAYKFLAGGVTVGLFYGLVTGREYLLVPAKLFPSLLLGLGIGLVVGFTMSIRGGFTTKELKTYITSKPNQGIRNAIRYSALFGLFFGLAFGLIFGLIYGPALFIILGEGYRKTFPANSGLIYGLSDGVIVAGFFWLLSGGTACIQHLLLRYLLWKDGSIPWNYVRFLDYTVDLALLRKVGGGYIFFHEFLREHFTKDET